LAAGADVKDDKFGKTPLLITATRVHKKLAKPIISKGEDILCAGSAYDS
jgi:ankyrin repeat protein